MGHRLSLTLLSATLLSDFSRKGSERMKLVPAVLNKDNEAELVEFHGSAHIAALHQANCLAEIPIGVDRISKGDRIYVRPI